MHPRMPFNPSDPASTEGLLLVDKPTGPTSHDIVAAIRKILGGVKTGHTGTLDPLASGLLVILVGKATKLAPFVMGDPKVYTGTLILGLTTDTLDIKGNVVAKAVCRTEGDQAADALASLKGKMEQIPPIYSAVKIRGKPSYKYARSGEEVERLPRSVRIYDCEMTGFRKQGEAAEVDFMISCSPGFYVREYASRIGEMLGCGGTLAKLRRLASGPFRVERALTIEELQRSSSQVSPPLDALEGLAKVTVREEWLVAARNGVPLQEAMVEKPVEAGFVAVMEPGGKLLGVHEVVIAHPFCSKPRRML